MRSGDVFGWAAVLDGRRNRLAKTVCLERTELIEINGEDLMRLIKRSPATGDVIMSRFATMITREFSGAGLGGRTGAAFRDAGQHRRGAGRRHGERMGADFVSPRRVDQEPAALPDGDGLRDPARALVSDRRGLEAAALCRDAGLTAVVREMFSKSPTFGLSVYTPEYYQHIGASVRRVAIAFFLATALGVPLGLFMGWSRTFREYVFPVFETLRPIPILAWVPLAILMFSGNETPVIFLDLPGLVLRDRAERDARRRIDR